MRQQALTAPHMRIDVRWGWKGGLNLDTFTLLFKNLLY